MDICVCETEACRGYTAAIPEKFPTWRDLAVMRRLRCLAVRLHGGVGRSNHCDGHRQRVRGHRIRIRREWAIRRRLGK